MRGCCSSPRARRVRGVPGSAPHSLTPASTSCARQARSQVRFASRSIAWRAGAVLVTSSSCIDGESDRVTVKDSFGELAEDYERHGGTAQSIGFWVLAVYRYGRWVWTLPRPAR